MVRYTLTVHQELLLQVAQTLLELIMLGVRYPRVCTPVVMRVEVTTCTEDLGFFQRVTAVRTQLLLDCIKDLISLSLFMQLVNQTILALDLFGLVHDLLSGLGDFSLKPLILPLQLLAGLLPEVDVAAHLSLDLLELLPPTRILTEHTFHLCQLLVLLNETRLQILDLSLKGMI
jgi:hypothetical protein